MQQAFNAQSKTIGEMLSGGGPNKLVVPAFQRGYSWEKKHVESFWKDLLDFQKEKDKPGGPEAYFLGPIVTLAEKKNVIEILDGQQRLATATILFSVLRDAGRSLEIKAGSDFAALIQRDFIAKEDDGFCLCMGETDDLFFREAIQEDNEIPTATKPVLRSHQNIWRAKTFLNSAVQSVINVLDQPAAVAFLKKMRATLRNDVVMAAIPVRSERDAFRIFETLNDRGLRLSVPDLLLNYLMREAQPEADRPQIRKTWNEMIQKMGKREINRFLRHLWISKYGDLKNQDLFSALKQKIEAASLNSLEFARSCASECTDYVALLTADKEYFAPSALPLVRALLTDLDVQPALPLLLSSYSVFTKEDFEKIARLVLVFTTRHSIIVNRDSSELESVLFKLAREVRSAKTQSEIKGILTSVKKTLREFSPSDEQVKAAAVDLVLSPDEARYILLRIARKLQTKTKEIGIDEANLEHIFPQNPEPEEWGGEKGQAELYPYLWHIGNLTILGRRINKAAANKEYGIKRAAYAAKTEIVMAQEIADKFEVWTRESIERRAQSFVPLMLDIWNFDNPSMV